MVLNLEERPRAKRLYTRASNRCALSEACKGCSSIVNRLPRKIPSPKPAQIVEGEAAISEAAALAGDIDLSDSKKLYEIRELARNNAREDHLNLILICGLYFIAFCGAVTFLVLVSQLVLPQQWCFLAAEDATRLQTFLLSGTIGSGITAAANRLKKPSKTGQY